MMQQHRAIKQKYPDAILLFRVGDFYETFGQDAIVASQVLGITLTRRNNGGAADSELAGFPHHALDTYLHKLVKAGYRVAICDQLEDPKQAKGIVKRGVTEMITPGLATSEKLLDHHQNNFLAGIHLHEKQFGLSFLDISTGEFYIAEGDATFADKLLQTFKPAEVIFQRQIQKHFKETFGSGYFTYALEEWIFDFSYANELLLRQFGTQSLKGFGVNDMPLGIISAGAVMHYLKETEHPNIKHISRLQHISRTDYMWLDKFTMRNLELGGSTNGDENSLYNVLNNTVTPMGARLLRRWLLMPLTDIEKINLRLHTVEYLVAHSDLRKDLIAALKLTGDIERLAAKIPLRKINPREVVQIGKGLRQVLQIKQLALASNDEYLQRIGEGLNGCEKLLGAIEQKIIPHPPLNLSKGGVIAAGIHEELDEYRNLSENGKEFLQQLQQREMLNTGINSLKIGFNNVFGYYLEVTNAHKDKVPAEWIRKQTLVNCERYITPELKDYEEKILRAEERILELEQQLFDGLLAELEDYLLPLQTNGQLAAIADCLCCFAENAIQRNYRKPVLHNGTTLSVTACRHPVIESLLPADQPYVSNDIFLDPDAQQIIILTGPNMSGKSAVLRQTALVTLMAHAGSFVPANDAQIPLTDRIFTRVGASDNIGGGESTFMVEMNETASIINNLSSRSLVLLDEIGRGTSTYDGISIAWSIVEFLHNSSFRPKTLFATHYHELNELEERCSRVKNFHITTKEAGNKIIFLRKLKEGGSHHSFGIHVAKMAGMPASLINRSNEILGMLEASRSAGGLKELNGEKLQTALKALPAGNMQLSIFDAHTEVFEDIREALSSIDINRLTPVEALMKLNEIKQKLK